MGRSRAGMTLVELLITIGVLVVAGVWLLSAYHSALHLTEVAQQTTVALNDLRDMMERIKATPFVQLQTNFPHNVANGPGGAQAYANVVGGYTLPAEQITVTHTPSVTADPRELSAQVTWTNRGRSYQRRITTVRASQAS
ncbi:MAG: prepilin-type N-terminal cleavage/methylation domain-containing protein [Candidatus Omnitrophica bacterium]|nr:prepilin-type N-terminal cleavage/methylation domain-containing protein [Candidatus Omnitrophota bacterium]